MGRLRDPRPDRAFGARRSDDAYIVAGPADRRSILGAAATRPFEEAVRVIPKNLRLASIATSKLGEVDPEVATAFDSACATMRGVRGIESNPSSWIRARCWSSARES